MTPPQISTAREFTEIDHNRALHAWLIANGDATLAQRILEGEGEEMQSTPSVSEIKAWAKEFGWKEHLEKQHAALVKAAVKSATESKLKTLGDLKNMKLRLTDLIGKTDADGNYTLKMKGGLENAIKTYLLLVAQERVETGEASGDDRDEESFWGIVLNGVKDQIKEAENANVDSAGSGPAEKRTD